MLELILGPGIFLFCWKPLGFFEVKIFASIRSSLSLELRSITSPPPPPPPTSSGFVLVFEESLHFEGLAQPSFI